MCFCVRPRGSTHRFILTLPCGQEACNVHPGHPSRVLQTIGARVRGGVSFLCAGWGRRLGANAPPLAAEGWGSRAGGCRCVGGLRPARSPSRCCAASA